ncbi:Vegetative incompatibility protein HET-E-1 [Paramyrothecium foliicola]|nr:Vegetative incompatibility protein HET-E-1 [Paramyrothecium foliicola]
MWLLNAKTHRLEDFTDSAVPQYAILSHTWGQNEVTFQDLQGFRSRINDPAQNFDTGHSKIVNTCRQAVQNGLSYVWIDTCCIDKSSSAELTEAINSMFQWYQRATVCYAYLSDVRDIDDPRKPDSEFRRSRWFTRGWTLQELLAPRQLLFYSRDWQLISPVTDLYETIEQVTGIERFYLQRSTSPWNFVFRQASVATRMSWASTRQTTRPEDRAYSLLGLFDVNMPLLYGEGHKAFIRLQEEIMKQTDDETILAWDWTPYSGLDSPQHGFLATSPAQFAKRQKLMPWSSAGSGTAFSITNRGLRITTLLRNDTDDNGESRYIAILRCSSNIDHNYGIALPLKKLDSSHSHRNEVPCFSRTDEDPFRVFAGESSRSAPVTNICISPRPWWPSIILEESWRLGLHVPKLPKGCFIVASFPSNEWSAFDKVVVVDPRSKHHPRYIGASCVDGEFVIRAQFVGDSWKTDLALGRLWHRSLSQAQYLRDLDYRDEIAINGRALRSSAETKYVFGRELILIDVEEKLEDWRWELVTIAGMIVGVGFLFTQLIPLVPGKKRRR